MTDVNIAKMVESAGSSYVNTQDNANTANAKAYTSPANMTPKDIIFGKSLIIEPSENGVPEPPSGGAAPKTKIPGSGGRLEGAGGSSGARPEGTSRTGEAKISGGEGHEESKSISDRSQQHVEHKPLEQDGKKNQDEKALSGLFKTGTEDAIPKSV